LCDNDEIDRKIVEINWKNDTILGVIVKGETPWEKIKR
jgi:hypothetical protein